MKKLIQNKKETRKDYLYGNGWTWLGKLQDKLK